MDEVKRVKLENEKNLVGSFMVVWRSEARVPAKILKFEDDKDGRRAIYELLGGPDKGKKYTSRFSPNQEIDLYDDDSVILAALAV